MHEIHRMSTRIHVVGDDVGGGSGGGGGVAVAVAVVVGGGGGGDIDSNISSSPRSARDP